MAIHDFPLLLLYNIPIKKEVKYLGIIISKDEDRLELLNIDRNIEKCRSILNFWLQRDITIFGRILLTKIESLSRLIYPGSSLPISTRKIKAINKLNFDFIWRKKYHYIRKNDIIKEYEDGGLKAIDFDIMNGVLKLKWLQSFIKNEHSFWFAIPSSLFKKCRGIKFLFTVRLELSKVPLKLSVFHKQVLLYWKMLFKHNFSPHKVSLWNNLLSQRKSLFMEEWWQKGIWSVLHMMDTNGCFWNYNDFCIKFNFNCEKNIIQKSSKVFLYQWLLC